MSKFNYHVIHPNPYLAVDAAGHACYDPVVVPLEHVAHGALEYPGLLARGRAQADLLKIRGSGK